MNLCLFSSLEITKKTHTDESILPIFVTLFKKTIHKLSKVAFAKTFIPFIPVYKKLFFHKSLLLLLNHFSSAMLLLSLK